jgi:hypothetical protein
MVYRITCLLILTLFFCAACKKEIPQVTAAPGPAYLYATSDNGLILREGPSATAKALKTLPMGAQLVFLEDGPTATIAGRTAPWKKVSHEGQTGFAFGGFLSPEQPALAGLAAELIKDEWGPEDFGAGYYIEFKADGTFQENFQGEGCGGYDGKFRIEGQTIFLEATSKECTRPNRSCTMRKNETSPFASLQLDCGRDQNCRPGADCDGDSQYFRKNSRLEEGVQRTVDGRAVLTMGQPNWKTTTNVKYRAEPHMAATAYKCKYGDTNPVEYDYIPEGRSVTVIARLPELERVGDWTNYWYYVQPEDDWYAGGCDPRRGWVFGEFLSP